MSNGGDAMARTLRYACFLVLRELNLNEDKLLGGTRFNKVMSLLQHELKGSDLDLKLPHCWYLYGDESVPQELPREVHFEHYECPERTFVRWIGPDRPSFNLPSPATKRIRELAGEVVGRYPAMQGACEATDDVYEYAPFPFQRDFRSFRERFAFIERYTRLSSNPQRNIFLTTFETAVRDFPGEEFPRLRHHASRFEVLTRLLLEDDRDRLPEAQELASEFWRLFCKHLRIHPKGHENVSEGRLRWWTKDADSHTRIYAEWFSEVAARHLEDERLSSALDPLDRLMLVPPDWGEGSEGASADFDEVVTG